LSLRSDDLDSVSELFFQFSQPGAFVDPLTEVLRNGARALLTQAVEAEVAALISCHADELTGDGRQRLVRRRPGR
jgi:putative transposase